LGKVTYFGLGALNGQKVEIYRNLHKKCFSIRHKGKVVDYLYDSEELILQDVKFAVQPAGRERVRREKKKNVHAFVRGTVIRAGGLHRKGLLRECSRQVWYEPYTMDSFEGSMGVPVYEGKTVVFRDGKVLV